AAPPLAAAPATSAAHGLPAPPPAAGRTRPTPADLELTPARVILPGFERTPSPYAIPANLVAITEACDLVVFEAPGAALRTGVVVWLKFPDYGILRVRVGQPIGDPKNRKFTGRVLPHVRPQAEPPAAPAAPPERAYEGPDIACSAAFAGGTVSP
ncbi:MAG: hypothetical protein HZA54_05145, partial [Planctomycetes bacterium]|nr:hypothetical protein [Planctomycetota bacterium]